MSKPRDWFLQVSARLGSPIQLLRGEKALAISFATSILPLFRPSDIQCMAGRGVKLDDAAWMKDPAGRLQFRDHANARRVYSKLSSGEMPPDGAWPQDRLDLFNQWMTNGFNA